MDFTEEPRQLIRSFSFELEQNLPPETPVHDLSRIIIENRRQDDKQNSATAPWRKYFEPWAPKDGDNNPLRIEAVRLSLCWADFRKRLGEEDRPDFETRPTMDGLIRMVESTARAWRVNKEETKWGKFMSRFHRVCNTLNSHSNILEILPNGSEYVSLFSGTLTSIIKASANHENIAKDLAESLTLIGENVVACEHEVLIYPTQGMQSAIADLYAHIFLFLEDIMKWYLKKRRSRILDSFNQDFLKHFEDSITNIQNKSDLIRRQAGLGQMAENRVNRLITEDSRIGLKDIARNQAEQQYNLDQLLMMTEKERKEREILAQRQEALVNMIALLIQQAEDYKHTSRLAQFVSAQNVLLPNPHHSEVNMLENNKVGKISTWSKDEILFNSKALEDSFHRDRLRPLVDSMLPLLVDAETLTRLKEWTEATGPSILSIAGLKVSSDVNDGDMSLLASKFICFAEKFKLPVISYFCELRRSEKLDSGHSKEEQAAISLVYALIRQLVELLELRVQTSVDLSAQRFKKLDGTIETWQVGILLLEDLVSLLPSTVFCIIDGFQWLDDRSTGSLLVGLLDLLRRSKMKVLLTTIGKSRLLIGELARTELLLKDENSRQESGARKMAVYPVFSRGDMY